MEKALADALGDDFRPIKARVSKSSDGWEGILAGIEIKCGIRFPDNEAARVAWGAILLKRRASIRPDKGDIRRYEDAIGERVRVKKKTTKKKSK